jgi:hypothetical protein
MKCSSPATEDVPPQGDQSIDGEPPTVTGLVHSQSVPLYPTSAAGMVHSRSPYTRWMLCKHKCGWMNSHPAGHIGMNLFSASEDVLGGWSYDKYRYLTQRSIRLSGSSLPVISSLSQCFQNTLNSSHLSTLRWIQSIMFVTINVGCFDGFGHKALSANVSPGW